MTEIDRLAPAARPSGAPILLMNWRDLLFLHWPVPVSALRPLIPPALTVDTFDGVAYIGLVPFQMRRICLPGLPPPPGASAVGEINVRTYVHHCGKAPGVWFFSLDATLPAAVIGARIAFKLPYYLAQIGQNPQPEQHADDPTPRIRYVSRRVLPGPVPAMCDVMYTPASDAARARPGTLEHFLIERYFLYSASRSRVFRAQVHHAPYPVEAATVAKLNENLIAASGIKRPFTAPLAHYASGVDTEVFPLIEV